MSRRHAEVDGPPLNYYGGKFKLQSWLNQFFPPHRRFAIPYGGSAGELWNKPPASIECYNDINGDLVNYFRVLRDPEKASILADMLLLTPYSREEHDRMKELSPDEGDDVQRAYRLVVLSFMGFGSFGSSRKVKNGYVSAIHDEKRIGVWTKLPAKVVQWTNRLRNVELESQNAFEFIRHKDFEDTLFYVDPPYVADTRETTDVYEGEMSEEEHVELSVLLHEVKGMVVLSGYKGDLYSELYEGWESHDKDTFANSRKGVVSRTETVWLSPITSSRLRGVLF